MHASLTPSRSFVDVLQEQIEDRQSNLPDLQQTVTAFPPRAVVSPIVPEKEGLRTAERTLQHTAGRESYGILGGSRERGERPVFDFINSSPDGHDALPDEVVNNDSLVLDVPMTSSYVAMHQPAFRVVI